MSVAVQRARVLAAAMLGSLILATPALAGPPWISVEVPANPHDPATRGALALVHAYHHGDAITTRLSGVAEGWIDGKRASVPVEIVATARTGVYAVRGKLPEKGAWLLVVTLDDHGSTATALVGMAADGRILSVRVPSDRNGEGWVVPKRVTTDDIETELRAVRVAARSTGTDGLALAGLVPLAGLLVVAGAVSAGARRRSAA
ncbi:MAG: hypothetical protein L0271_22050 [Gemmatimonadetes bacterium]|nr:hypothetical protein [Gemmatimonadota bacterium]